LIGEGFVPFAIAFASPGMYRTVHDETQSREVTSNELAEAVMPNLDRAESLEYLSESQEEARKIRRLQVMIGMVMSVIGQDPNLTIEEASELAAGAKRAALAMFPDKELAYDILYKPRLQRLMNERFRLQ
jgi:hypothetical protein